MSSEEKSIRVRANLVLDASGNPVAHRSGEDVDHYEIELSIEDPPDDTYAVTYKLHNSYYDPVREVRKRAGGFSELITSYGEYTVKATVRTKSGNEAVQVSLHAALARAHGKNPPASIRRAIESIRDH
jgi:transcription initiation factor IIF auxiliary subunit